MSVTGLDPTPTAPRKAPPAAVVIFGASGDLTERKLLPALSHLRTSGLAEGLTLVGVARSKFSEEDFVARVAAATGDALPADRSRIRYVSGGYDNPDTYRRLAEVLADVDREGTAAGNKLFYLATPASAFADIIAGLAGAGLNQRSWDGRFTRIVIEKPYGHDLASALLLDDQVHTAFHEADVFRIDHYLAKETVQNLLALRFANAIFQPIWERSWVDHVQITVAETLGVEGRGGFYEHAGAMRDIVQNHVLQVLALALMEPPTSFSGEAVRNEKVKLLQSIRLPDLDRIDGTAVRGQYTRGGTPEELMEGYREETGVNPLSRTETYVALRLDVDNWRWAGVPFYVRTGKRLPTRATEVILQFSRPPHLPLPAADAASLEPDTLIMRIQPDEAITLRFGAKIPGHDFRVRTAEMQFCYARSFAETAPDAYERLLFDALVGDPTLFIRSDEVLQSWRIVDPIIARWAEISGHIPLYEAGSWGPPEADALIERDGRRWYNPGSG